MYVCMYIYVYIYIYISIYIYVFIYTYTTRLEGDEVVASYASPLEVRRQ